MEQVVTQGGDLRSGSAWRLGGTPRVFDGGEMCRLVNGRVVIYSGLLDSWILGALEGF